MTDDPGRNEFDVLLQRTRRISIGSPTYPEVVGIKWAASELARLRAENAEARGQLCRAREAIGPLASMIHYFKMLWNGRAYRGEVPPLTADTDRFNNAKEASDAQMVLAMEAKANAALDLYNAAAAPCPHGAATIVRPSDE